MKNKLLILFFITCILNIGAVITESNFGVYLTKPLLMIVLGTWYYLNIKNNFSALAKATLAGIIFSFFGDTFLMFTDKIPNLFLLGLGCFLITHIFYIIVFLSYNNQQKGLIHNNRWIAILVLTYLIVFFYFLNKDIPSAFMIPVLIYSIVISLMLLSAINISIKINKTTGKQLIMGAIFFVISDSLIAVNKFKNIGNVPEYFLGAIIMATYLLGQYFIIKSTIAMINSNSPSIMSSPK